jgi:magnesium transporter
MGKKGRRQGAAKKALTRSMRVTDRLVRRWGKPAGAAPGTVIHAGRPRVEQVTFEVMHFDADHFDERHPTSLEACFPWPDGSGVTWLNIDGVHDVQQLYRLGELVDVHPLVLEDVASTGQRAKLEDYDSQLYIVLRMLRHNDETGQIDEEQLSLVLGPQYVISVQEAPGDVFDPVRDRLRQAKGRIRRSGADFLAYALMDAVVDAYFVAVEKLSDRIESLEEQVLKEPGHPAISEIHRIRGELLIMRRAVWPLRDLFNSMVRDESSLIGTETRVFLRDAYDHAVQVIDTVETLREIVSGLMELHMSSVSNRLNEVMKVLTIIATVFIPLTFLVGVYGMNFRFMPELSWRWAYPALWAVMLLIAVAMLVQFRRRSWL